MFQHYILFRGREPIDLKKPGYKTVDERTATASEKDPLIHSGDGPMKDNESIQDDCGAVGLSKKVVRLLRLAR